MLYLYVMTNVFINLKALRYIVYFCSINVVGAFIFITHYVLLKIQIIIMMNNMLNNSYTYLKTEILDSKQDKRCTWQF